MHKRLKDYTRDDLRANFAEALRALMASREITGKELSLSTGIRESSITEYKNCDKQKGTQDSRKFVGQLPDACNLWKLAEYFNVPIDTFFARNDSIQDDDITTISKYTGLSGDAVQALVDIQNLHRITGYTKDLDALSSFIANDDSAFVFTVCRMAGEMAEQYQNLRERQRELLKQKSPKEKIPVFELLCPEEDDKLSYMRYRVINAFEIWLDKFTGYDQAREFRRKLFQDKYIEKEQED